MPALASDVAVLDACVLIPAALRDTLLRLAEVGLYVPIWSDVLLDEVERNLVKHELMTEARASRLIAALRAAFPAAAVAAPVDLTDRMTNHPKDRHVLATGLAAGAKVIVTYNLRDFALEHLAPFGLVALTPDQFLCGLGATAMDAVVLAVVEQARALRHPPMTVRDVLDRLRPFVPNFADTVARQIAADARPDLA